MAVRSLTRALAAAAVLAHAGGCITITPPAKPEPAKPQPAVQPTAPTAGVVQAVGLAPQPAAGPTARAAGPTVSVGMPKIQLHTERKVQALEIAAQWGRRVEHLPDPARDGAMGPGLVGQLFLYGNDNPLFGHAKPTPATADGKLTVKLFQEIVEVGQPPKSVFLGQWVFEKDALKSLKCFDERWGPHYQIFLPWPSYNPEVTKIRLTAKYEPEGHFPLYAQDAVIAIDTSLPGSNTVSSTLNTTIDKVPRGLLIDPTQPGSGPPMQPLPSPTPLPAPGAIPSRAWQ
jgi:hypothetical protein